MMMNEIEAFKMLEELIKNEIENNQYLNNNYSNGQAIYLTPPASQDNLHVVDDYPKKPNRPYSYYIATNFHPLDLTMISEKVNDLNLNESQTAATTTTTTNTTSIKNDKNVKIRTKKADRASKTKRLSASLGDIITSTINTHSTNSNDINDILSNSIINTTQNTPVTRKKLKDFELVDEFTVNESNNYFRNRRNQTNFFSTNLNKSRAKSSQYYSSTRRLNKFIRGIFRLDDENQQQQQPQQQHDITTKETENSKFKSKFTRFFMSFRINSINNNNTSDNRKKSSEPELRVMDERPSSKLLMLPEIKLCITTNDALPSSSSSSPLVGVFKRNELNYTEIENCLRKLTTSSYIDLSSKTDSTGYVSGGGCIDSASNKTTDASTSLSSPQSTISSSLGSLNNMKSSSCYVEDNYDIPFIDDDLDSSYELNLITNTSNNNNNTQSVLTSVSTTSYENTHSLFNLITDLVIQNYLKSISYEKLESIMNDFCQNEWLNIVLIFDMTNRAIKMLNEKTDESTIVQLKEICAKYINDKYYDFICQNGGLESVPIVEMLQTEIKTKYNERIH